jgi:hypothetical protein
MNVSDKKVGERFGRLVITDLYKPGLYRKHIAVCLCDCGKVIEIPTCYVRTRVSCGCAKQGDGPFNKQYYNYKRTAKRRGLVFALSEEEARTLFTSDCYYCGEKPSRKVTSSGSTYGTLFNGIDRKDNGLGYVSDNVVPCCTACNYFKVGRNHDEFLTHILKIARHTRRKRNDRLCKMQKSG